MLAAGTVGTGLVDVGVRVDGTLVSVGVGCGGVVAVTLGVGTVTAVPIGNEMLGEREVEPLKEDVDEP